MKCFLHFKNLYIVYFFATFLYNSNCFSNIRIADVFNSNMVLRRNVEIPIWGNSHPNEKITLFLNDEIYTSQADKLGNWKIIIPPHKADHKNYLLKVIGSKSKQEQVFKNILFGDVWLASGQSNMEMPLEKTVDFKEVQGESFKEIRYLNIQRGGSYYLNKHFNDSNWKELNESIQNEVSAVAYFFARKIYQETKIPIGIILSAYGGSGINAWLPPSVLDKDKNLASVLKQYQDRLKDRPYTYLAPSSLFAGMIYPLIPFPITGVIWYQGESNVSDGSLYYHKLKWLIQGWRKEWRQGDFPFYFTQIGHESKENVDPEALPRLREAMTKALKLPNTGMAVATDFRKFMIDGHPAEKKEVGHRLAYWALNKFYGKKDVSFSGPMPVDFILSKHKIRIKFDHAKNGFVVDKDGNSFFEVAGSDKKFKRAKFNLFKNSIEVSNDLVKNPVYVRFGWDQTSIPSIKSKEGLPIVSFRNYSD